MARPNPATISEPDLHRLVAVRRSARTGDAQRLREAVGLSRREVAASLGMSYARLQKWEMGLRSPSGPEALAYARLLERLQRQATA